MIKKFLLIFIGLLFFLFFLQQLTSESVDFDTLILGTYKGDDDDNGPGNTSYETLTLFKNGTYQLETNVPSGNKIIKSIKKDIWHWGSAESDGDVELFSGQSVRPLLIQYKFFWFGAIQLCSGENLKNCYTKQ